MNPPRRIRVLVIDGDALTRAGLLVHLRGPKLRCVCGEAASAVQARERCVAQPPEVILLDLPLPGGDGLSLLRELARLAPGASMAVLGMNENGASVERVFAAGAQAFIHREDAPGAFGAALAAMRRGERFVSARATQTLLAGLAGKSSRGLARRGGGGKKMAMRRS